MAEPTSDSSNGQEGRPETPPAAPTPASASTEDYPMPQLKSITAGAGRDRKNKKTGR